MAVRQILFASAAAAALMSPALAGSAHAADDYYICNDHLCYDDQAEATRELNRQALENPGYDEAMPSYGHGDYDEEYRSRDQYRGGRYRYRGRDNDGDRDDQYRGQDDDRGYDQGMPSDDQGYSGDDDN
jgi:hypothetical protein